MILRWGNTLILGYFKTAELVGLFNGASLLASFITTVLTAAGFIFVPIASKLFSKNLMNEMRRTYQILTKWIFSAALPLFFILFLVWHTNTE